MNRQVGEPVVQRADMDFEEGGSTPPPPPEPPAPAVEAADSAPPSPPSAASPSAEATPSAPPDSAPTADLGNTTAGAALVESTGGMENSAAQKQVGEATAATLWLTPDPTQAQAQISSPQPVLVRPQGTPTEVTLYGDADTLPTILAQAAPASTSAEALRLYRDESQAAEQLPDSMPLVLQEQSAEKSAITYGDAAEVGPFLAEAATPDSPNSLALYASEADFTGGGQLVPLKLQLEGEEALHVAFASSERLNDFLAQTAVQQRDGLQLFPNEGTAEANDVTDATALVVQEKGEQAKYVLFASAAALADVLNQAQAVNRGPTIMAYADEAAAAEDISNPVKLLIKQDEADEVVLGYADQQELATFMNQAEVWQDDVALDEIARQVYRQLHHQLVVERERRPY